MNEQVFLLCVWLYLYLYCICMCIIKCVSVLVFYHYIITYSDGLHPPPPLLWCGWFGSGLGQGSRFRVSNLSHGAWVQGLRFIGVGVEFKV